MGWSATTPTAATCAGSDEKLYGSTCCRSSGKGAGEASPGAIILSCHGPQIGKACTRRSDCDLACFCEVQTGPLSNTSGPSGPAIGTKGVTGACGGLLQMGVWMCQIDENGVVIHRIIG
jgi:hypothetical protein